MQTKHKLRYVSFFDELDIIQTHTSNRWLHIFFVLAVFKNLFNGCVSKIIKSQKSIAKSKKNVKRSNLFIKNYGFILECSVINRQRQRLFVEIYSFKKVSKSQNIRKMLILAKIGKVNRQITLHIPSKWCTSSIICKFCFLLFNK